MLRANWHTYQVLTKRAERLAHLLSTKLAFAATAPHIWWGVSVEDKKYGVPRITQLRQTPAAVRFLSIEPLLEDLGALDLTRIHWVIVGGESGHGARRMQSAWVDAIKEQCDRQGVLFFFKQWGGVQKGKHGRTLNGRTHDDMPARAAHQAPPRAERDALIHQLTRLTSQWEDNSLVQLVRGISVA
jgi:protein gp37